MRHFSLYVFLLALGGVMLSSVQSAPVEDLQQLIEGLAVQQTYAELDMQAMRIAKRLDQLTTSALEGNKMLYWAKKDLRAVLANESRLELAEDVHLFRIPNSDRILVVYNLPLTGSSRKVVLRVWHPGTQTENKGFLKPVQDVQGKFDVIPRCPIRDIYWLMRQDGLYVLLFGESGHGRGRRAISMWNLDKEECVWVKKFDYGEECKVLVGNDRVTLELELEEFGCEVRKRTEIYGWKNDKFLQLQNIPAEDREGTGEKG